MDIELKMQIIVLLDKYTEEKDEATRDYILMHIIGSLVGQHLDERLSGITNTLHAEEIKNNALNEINTIIKNYGMHMKITFKSDGFNVEELRDSLIIPWYNNERGEAYGIQIFKD